MPTRAERLVAFLERNPGSSVSLIADEMGLDAADTWVLILDTERNGQVLKTRDGVDKPWQFFAAKSWRVCQAIGQHAWRPGEPERVRCSRCGASKPAKEVSEP